jgi:hypothetical protein
LPSALFKNFSNYWERERERERERRIVLVLVLVLVLIVPFAVRLNKVVFSSASRLLLKADS